MKIHLEDYLKMGIITKSVLPVPPTSVPLFSSQDVMPLASPSTVMPQDFPARLTAPVFRSHCHWHPHLRLTPNFSGEMTPDYAKIRPHPLSLPGLEH